MGLTDFCDVFASIHEDGFNRVFDHIASQRPSLFNYGTSSFVAKPELLCCKPEWVHDEVVKRSNPIVTLVPYLPIPGYLGDYGLEFNFSLHELEIDFFPTNKFTLPNELGSKLDNQSIAIRAKACAGIACPSQRVLDEYVIYPEPYRPTVVFGKDGTDKNFGNDKGFSIDPNQPKKGLPFDSKGLLCFSLELYVVMKIEMEIWNGEPVISLKLRGLEIVDIKPDGLENSLECYMKTTLQMGILPHLRVAFNSIALTIGDFISVVPTPISSDVPFNPSVDDDQISVFLNLQNP